MKKLLPITIKKLLLLATLLMAMQTTYAASLSVHFPDITLHQGGTGEMVVSYDNDYEDLGGFQIEFVLPNGISLVDAQPSNALRQACPHLEVYFNKREFDGTTVILSTNFYMESFPVGRNDFLVLAFKADNDVPQKTYEVTTTHIELPDWGGDANLLDNQTFHITVDDPIIIDGISYEVNENDGTAEVTHLPNNQIYKGRINLPSAISYKSKDYVVKRIVDGAFSNSEIESIVIPNSIDSIADNAYEGCQRLKSVAIDNNKFVEYFFTGSGRRTKEWSRCRWLFGDQVEEYILGDNITYIDYYAFGDCANLKYITIGSGVNYIEEDVFRDSPNIIKVTSLITTPFEIPDIFEDNVYQDAKLIVPDESLEQYKNTPTWNRFHDIKAISEGFSRLSIQDLNSVDGGSYNLYQNMDGTVDIQLNVTLTNIGEVDLKAGDDNFTLSLVKKSYYESNLTVFDDVTFNINRNLAAGETATIIASFKAPKELETGWMYLKVKENISKTISNTQVKTLVKSYDPTKSNLSIHFTPDMVLYPGDTGEMVVSYNTEYDKWSNFQIELDLPDGINLTNARFSDAFKTKCPDVDVAIIPQEGGKMLIQSVNKNGNVFLPSGNQDFLVLTFKADPKLMGTKYDVTTTQIIFSTLSAENIYPQNQSFQITIKDLLSLHFPDITLHPANTGEMAVSYNTDYEKCTNFKIEFDLPNGILLANARLGDELRAACPDLDVSVKEENGKIMIQSVNPNNQAYLPSGNHNLLILTFKADRKVKIQKYEVATSQINISSLYAEEILMDNQTFFITVKEKVITTNAQLILWLADGSIIYYNLGDRPKISFADGKMIVSTIYTSFDYSMNEVIRYTYVSVMDDIALLQDKDVEISNDGNTISFQDLSEGQVVNVYDISGTLKLSKKSDGTPLSINISSFPKGVYVVKSKDYTFKLLKK